MAGGFLSGLVTGAVVSGAALAAVSVAVGTESTHRPDAAVLEVPADAGFNQARDDTAARLPQDDGAPDIVGVAPQVNTPTPDDVSQVAAQATQPGARPELGTVQAGLSAPQIGASDSGMAVAQTDAQVAGGDGATPDVTMDGASISTDPAQPSLPEVEGGAGLAPQPSDAEGADAHEEIATEEMASEDVAPDDMIAEDMAPDATAPDDMTAGDRTPEDAMPEVQTGSPDAAQMADGSVESGDDGALSGTIGDMAVNIETQRLPAIEVAPADTESPDAAVAETDAPQPALAAIKVYGEPFENPEGKPLMAIVLIDDGSSPIRLDALASFPYPLSFALDPAWPGAAEAMRRYRDAGFEVLAIADLPTGATAHDTETTIQTVDSVVSEAVAILEGTGTGLQINREASEQLAPILLETGQGLVLYAKGLETAPKLIKREGVPVGTIFRDFDSKDQSATVIRRFLDQAAFKAGRDEGGVIMLGRLRADTISALLLWGLQDRAGQVALAPISAVLSEGS